MEGKKIIIVGGVAGGATTAARLRRLDETSHIILIERGEHISFANCGLPYYIGETIKDRNKLFVQTAENMSKRFNMDIRPLNEVVSINKEEKLVTIKNLQTNDTYEESYDYLVLSPGASPIVPPIPGLNEAKHVFTLRNIPDTDGVKTYIDEYRPQKAVIVGGGFIGLEMAENLIERGLDVTLVEMANQVMAPLDYEMAAVIQNHLVEKGVNLILGDGVSSFESEGSIIKLSSGRSLETELTLLSIGVKPESSLAKNAGIELGERGSIKVNQHLRTSDESIYAVGDAIEVKDYINGHPSIVPLAWPANRQGRIVANNIYGRNEAYHGTLGTAIAKVFDYSAASTGLNEKTLQKLGIPYEVVHIHPNSHASYYPGASTLSMKLVFDKNTGKIYGAQAVGKGGADKRIDVIATAIKGGLTVLDLPDLELAYAPPFSSAKDPVNMLGYVASNIMEGQYDTLQWSDIKDLPSDSSIVDVREPDEYDRGYIEGAINIPLNDLRHRLNELSKDQEQIIYCQAGLRGYLASRILVENGFKVKNLDGGWRTYSAVYDKQKTLIK